MTPVSLPYYALVVDKSARVVHYLQKPIYLLIDSSSTKTKFSYSLNIGESVIIILNTNALQLTTGADGVIHDKSLLGVILIDSFKCTPNWVQANFFTRKDNVLHIEIEICIDHLMIDTFRDAIQCCLFCNVDYLRYQ